MTVAQQYHEMTCMEIWGGNRAVRSGVSVPGIDCWVWSRPVDGQARGGDIHYVSFCGDGDLSRYIVADVAGHGEAVGELAQTLRNLLRENINTIDATHLVQELNRAFGELTDRGVFATALVATYYAPEDQLILCNAGHPRPLWYSTEAGRWDLLRPDLEEACEEVLDLPLGVIPETSYRQFAVPLAPGDVLVAYTDPLIEARGPDGRMIGEEGLRELASDLDQDAPDRLADELLATVEAHRGTPGWDDDVTLMALRQNGKRP